MVLNEPIAPVELDTDRVDQDQPGAFSHLGHHHHHYYQHHPDFLTDNPVQAHSARQKRKMKLKDMALRESRDPQDLIDLPEPMDNKRRHIDSSSKESKGKGLSKDALRTEKRLKIFREEDSGSREKVKRAQKAHRERSESQVSTRDSTPTTPNDPGIEYGSPPRQRRQHESNISSPSAGQRPRPFVCEIEDCGKRFVDALQLERHIERHGPKELECDLDMCGKLFSSIMLLRRHQSMVHKRRSEKWESPPGTTRQRSGRSRRREPRIVASGDIMDPDELERQPRGYVAEEDQLADDHDEDEGQGDVSPVHNEVKKTKESRTPKATKTPKDSKTKEHKSPVAYIPKRLAPKYEDQESAGGMIMDIDSLDDGQQTDLNEAKATAPRRAVGSEEAVEVSPIGPAGPAGPAGPTGPRPRPFRCTYDDCKKVFIDATQLERHLERHGPKELECGIDGCRKRFSAQMLLRRHQSMVHKRRSPAVPVVSRKVASAPMAPTPAAPAPSSRLAYPPTDAAALGDSSADSTPPDPSQDNVPNHAE
ncbi:hypothetical protein BG011_001471 [Mortierella polycephala]|uniref:C2H2-type domain-containing protein n=1 Tax=Mortierella polycephala TaxID=41804 RepID=A0A9P6PGB6_9FUNG|nr:hypothetical protein BG011_001471 [Mortierella polycephala]